MKEPIAKEPERRKRRNSISTRNILTVSNKDPNYHYRVVNDSGDRIQELLDRDYELVDSKTVRVGDKTINGISSEGSKSQVSVGQGQKAFVMRIRKDWFIEDQQEKQAEVKKLEDATKTPNISGAYGKLEITS